MTTLDKVIQMQQRGLSDAEISKRLQNEGVGPTEINDSINQARIKNAVSPPEQTETMQNNTPNQEEIEQQTFEPQPEYQESYAPQYQQPQEIYPQDNYYQQTPQAYGQQDYYAPQAGTSDVETISEIAEQVATEKINDYKNGVGNVDSFKNTIQDKVNDIDDRLKRIEANIDRLQQAIIGKIGEFGENNAMIHKELENIHGTMSKLMNPLIDNINEIKKLSK